MSYSLDGANDYFYYATNLGITDYPFTISGWIKTSNAINQSLGGLQDWSNVNVRQNIRFRDPADTDVYANSRDASTGANAFSTGQYYYVPNQWVHVAAVFTSDTSRTMYVDGADAVENTTSIDYENALIDSFTIGASYSSGPSQPFVGNVAEIAVWSSALSSGSVASLAGGAAASVIDSGNLVTYWPLVDDLVDDVNGWTLSSAGSPSQDADHPTISGTVYVDLAGVIEGDVSVTSTLTKVLFKGMSAVVEGDASVSGSLTIITFVGLSATVEGDGSITASMLVNSPATGINAGVWVQRLVVVGTDAVWYES